MQMLTRSAWSWFLVFCVPVVCTASARTAEPTYWQDVRPILRKHCTACHSAKNQKELDVSGGLALDSLEAIVRRVNKPIVRLGQSKESALIKAITSTDEEKRMPLSAPPLSAANTDVLRRWIDGGAQEGAKPATAETTDASRLPTRTRKLDVILTTAATPPKGVLGASTAGKLDLLLKIGPLAPVAAVAFSPDGKLLAAGGYGCATIWDLASARPAKVLTNVLGAVNDLRFSPDGKFLAVAGGQPSAKGDLRLYQTSDWKLLTVLLGHDDVVFSVSFAPDGKHLASASFDKTVRIWDLATHKAERTLSGHSDFVYAVAYSQDGKWLASASKDRTVKIVEPDTGKSRFTLSGMDQDVMAVAVSPDGKSVVSSGLEPGLYWWDARTGQRSRVQGGHGVAVHEVGFSKDGQYLVSAGADRTVRLWHGATGAAIRSFSVGSIAYAVAISPNARLIASGSFDGLVRLWDVGTGRMLLTFLSLPPSGDRHDWLVATPEGYASSSPGLAELGQWRIGGQAIAVDAAWKALGKPELVAKAAAGQPLPPPMFEPQSPQRTQR
jgi:WD40 repeat protein